jgi:hypothetical protein
MKTAICCIAKCENDYLLEWVEYHIALGFTHIYIYDNNDIDGERIEDILFNYVNTSVFIIDCRGKKAYQSTAYTEFYRKYGSKYSWIAYIDIDEFLTFSKKSNFSNINDYLCQVNDNYELIHLNWMSYGDNGIVEYKNNRVIERFINPLPFDMHVQYDFPENNHVKSIMRGGLNLGQDTRVVAHSPEGNYKICDENGVEIVKNSYFKPYSFDTIYVRHYTTKTIYEWMLKITKGRNVGADKNSELYRIERFFKYNEDTLEKRNVIKQFELLKNSGNAQYKTEIYFLKEDLKLVQNENIRLKKDLNKIQNSKAYRLGKILLRPLNLLK